MERETQRETHAIILDFLQNGYPFDRRPSHLKTPIIQALGTTKFALLELVPKKDVHVQPFEKIYVGDDERPRIHHVNGRIGMKKLTQTARSELPHAVKAIVEEREQEFVRFFNTAPPLSTRMHALELLPGVGKKQMQEFVAAREEQPFTSFADIRKRVKCDPERLIINRLLKEIGGDEKHRLFVR